MDRYKHILLLVSSVLGALLFFVNFRNSFISVYQFCYFMGIFTTLFVISLMRISDNLGGDAIDYNTGSNSGAFRKVR